MGKTTGKIIKWPFGIVDQTTAIAYAATKAYTIKDNFTMLQFAIFTGNLALTLTADSNLQVGALVHLQWSTTGTEVLSLGTGSVAPSVTGVAGKRFVYTLVYDGTSFVPFAAGYQIN